MPRLSLILAILCVILPTAVHANAKSTNSAQQNRMKGCAAAYRAQNLPKSEYRTFMSSCLKKPHTKSK